MKLRSYSLAAVAAALIANAAFADGTPVKAPVGAPTAVETKTEVKKQETTAIAAKSATDVKQASSGEKTAVHKHVTPKKPISKTAVTEPKKGAMATKVSAAPTTDASAKTSK